MDSQIIAAARALAAGDLLGVTGASVDAIETFTIVGFAILMGTFSISAPPAMNIQIIPTITHIPTTTTMGI